MLTQGTMDGNGIPVVLLLPTNACLPIPMVVAASATCSITINVFTKEGILLSPSFPCQRAPESSSQLQIKK